VGGGCAGCLRDEALFLKHQALPPNLILPLSPLLLAVIDGHIPVEAVFEGQALA